MKRKLVSLASALMLSLVSLSAVPLSLVHATAGTCTWTGSGDGTSFSDADNWSGCGGAPTNGDSLAFNDGTLSSSTENLNNDISGLTLNNISFSGTATNYGSYNITGDGIYLTGGITDNSSRADNYVGFSSITLLNSQTFTNNTLGSAIGPSVGSGSLDIGSYTLTLDSSAADTGLEILDNITGSGTINVKAATSINSPRGDTVELLGDDSSFTGQINLLQGLLTGSVEGLTAGGLTISNGATLLPDDPAGQGGETISTPITMSGDGWSDWGAIIKDQDQGGNSSKLTLSGPITLLGDTAVATDSTMTFTGSISGGYKITLIPGSTGKLVISSSNNTSASSNGTTTAPVLVTTVASSQPSQTVNVPANNEYVINGVRGATTVENGGLLKGTGTVGALTVDAGGTVAPGHSPGCLNTGDLTEGGTYAVDIDGTTACSGYDQLKVTGTVNLTGGVLTVAIGSGYTPKVGDKYEIIDNNGTDAVTGTLSYKGTKLAQGSTFKVGSDVYQINYKGGNGNDVVLSVKTAATSSKTPGTPDTGLRLAADHPLVSLAGTVMLAGGVYLLYRKVSLSGKRR